MFDNLKKKAISARDYAVEHAEPVAVLTLVSVVVLHEVGYFIRSVKM
jgi:hypothetical protein